MLTVEIPQKPFDKMQDLVSNNITVGSAEMHACDVLKESNNFWANELSKKCSPYGTSEKGFEIIKENQNFAMTEGRAFLDYKRRQIFTNA